MAASSSMRNTNYTFSGRATTLNIVFQRTVLHGLPPELIDRICTMVQDMDARSPPASPPLPPDQHHALVPDPYGRCFLLGIDVVGRPLPGGQATPIEIRNLIFRDFVPVKDSISKPVCEDDLLPPPILPSSARPKRNKTSDIMVLNSTIKNEMTLACYEERTFEIHVHEGLVGGGIEFLDSGRQPLHYKSGETDLRFARFRAGEEFGFQKLKKVKIVIFPNRTDGFTHIPVYTHYMILSIVRLLQRGSQQRDRIVSITVQFARGNFQPQASNGRMDIMAGENPWWDPRMKAPKTSSIHNLPDFELALRPLGNLTRVHTVHIELPSKVRDHQPSLNFVKDLVTSMRSDASFGMLMSDELDRHIESIRAQAEQHIFDVKYGTKPCNIEPLGEADVMEDDDDAWDAPATHQLPGIRAWNAFSAQADDSTMTKTMDDLYREQQEQCQILEAQGALPDWFTESVSDYPPGYSGGPGYNTLHEESRGPPPQSNPLYRSKGKAKVEPSLWDQRASGSTRPPRRTVPFPYGDSSLDALFTSDSYPMARNQAMADNSAGRRIGDFIHAGAESPRYELTSPQVEARTNAPFGYEATHLQMGFDEAGHQLCTDCQQPLPLMNEPGFWSGHECEVGSGSGWGGTSSSSGVRALARESSGSSQLGTTQFGSLTLQGAGDETFDAGLSDAEAP